MKFHKIYIIVLIKNFRILIIIKIKKKRKPLNFTKYNYAFSRKFKCRNNSNKNNNTQSKIIFKADGKWFYIHISIYTLMYIMYRGYGCLGENSTTGRSLIRLDKARCSIDVV